MITMDKLDITTDEEAINTSATDTSAPLLYRDIKIYSENENTGSTDIGGTEYRESDAINKIGAFFRLYVHGILPRDIVLDKIEKDIIGFPGDRVVVFYSHQNPQWWGRTDELEELSELPDIFSPTYHRKVIFSKSVKIQPSQMRRLKPYIAIDPDATYEDEDE